MRAVLESIYFDVYQSDPSRLSTRTLINAGLVSCGIQHNDWANKSDDFVLGMLRAFRKDDFSPDQPRDETGKWSASGHASDKHVIQAQAVHAQLKAMADLSEAHAKLAEQSKAYLKNVFKYGIAAQQGNDAASKALRASRRKIEALKEQADKTKEIPKTELPKDPPPIPAPLTEPKDLGQLSPGEAYNFGIEMASSWRNELDPTEVLAINAYTGSSYSPINGALRDKHTNYSLRFQDRIDKITSGLNKAAIPESIKVYRKGYFEPGTFKAGNVLQDKGFVSTSLKQGVWAGDTHFHITLPVGAKAQFIGGMSRSPREIEVLIQRGSKFKISSVITHPSHREVHMEYIP